MSCETSQIKYIGNGTTTIYTFPFEYMKESDIEVLVLNQATNVYDNIQKNNPTYGWQLANATTVQFNTAPPSGTNFLIARNTDVEELSAEFFPGSAIRAKDLNDNFEQLQMAVEEDRCNLSNVGAGPAGTVAVGTTTTGEPGTDALVSNVGEPTAAILDFTIPRGDVGPEGPAGLGVSFQGTIDATTESAPANPSDGDLWYNTTAGTVTSGWTGITGDAVGVNDRLIYNGTVWNILPTPALWVQSGDTLSPINSSSKVTSVGTSSSDNDNVLTTKKYVDDGIASIVPGGVTQLVAGNNVTLSPTSGTGVVTVNSTGGGGGSGDTFYGGASAWGSVDANGNVGASSVALLNGLNVASVSGSGTGLVLVTFATPMPDANYAVNVSYNNASVGQYGDVSVGSKTPTSFQVQTYDNNNNGAWAGFAFTVYATNALPPKGGTGTDAWGSAQSDGTLEAGFNVASITRTGTGLYDVVFTTPMPSVHYAVVTQPLSSTSRNALVYNITTTGFTVNTYSTSSNSSEDSSFGFAVNATNATLPLTVTQEQIESAINNPGASAWGYVSASGELVNGMNIASSVKNGVANYIVEFATPMPDANYSVVFGCQDDSSGKVAALYTTDKSAPFTKTANGFSYYTQDLGTPSNAVSDVFFAVFATNALPPKGGTGTDAWATVEETGTNGPMTVPASFNVASVTRTAKGKYDVVFTNPMPTANYAVNAQVTSDTSINAPLIGAYAITTTGFSLFATNGTSAIERSFCFSVNATNATLPQTVTQEQIEAAINNPGLSAWANIEDDATINNGLNVASVVNTGQGEYTVTFQTPLPDSNYSVSGVIYTDDNLTVRVIAQRTTGFDVVLSNSSNNRNNMPFSVQVAATNALPLTGGTGTDSWGTVQSDGTLDASFNVASVTRTSTGRYDVVFTTPMPTANYAVNATVFADGTPPVGWGPITGVYDITTTGFSVNCVSADGNNIDRDFSFTVNATNAVLPQAFTEQEVQQVVDLAKSGATNPGLSAWGHVSVDGTLLNGLNTASVVKLETAKYSVTFSTPMPDANYAVTFGGCNSAAASTGMVYPASSKTATGFEVYTWGTGGDENTDWSFMVAATNALPPTGGTGTDSWGSVAADGTLGASFNAASVTKTGTGAYDVVFTTPMPTADYAAVIGGSGTAGDYGNYWSYDKTTTGFTVNTQDANNIAADTGFSFTVNATDAVLPSTFTEAEIQAVVDLAKSGAANGASAWGSVAADGTLQNGLNVSVSKPGPYRVVFTTPMPDANYSIVFGGEGFPTYVDGTKTANGFDYYVYNAGGSGQTIYESSFAVFATNVTLPITVTQAEIDTVKTAVDRIETLEGSIPDVSDFISSSYFEQRLSPYATTAYVETRISSIPVSTVTQQDITLAATSVDAKFDMLRSAIQESTDFATLKARLLAVLQ